MIFVLAACFSPPFSGCGEQILPNAMGNGRGLTTIGTRNIDRGEPFLEHHFGRLAKNTRGSSTKDKYRASISLLTDDFVQATESRVHQKRHTETRRITSELAETLLLFGGFSCQIDDL